MAPVLDRRLWEGRVMSGGDMDFDRPAADGDRPTGRRATTEAGLDGAELSN